MNSLQSSPTTPDAGLSGMHRRVARDDESERFLADLFDRLWDRYRTRVKWVRDYERLIQTEGASFTNDHIAFRTMASQEPAAGIASLSRLFESLGYRAAGCYQFPDKHLNSVHYQHPNSHFPKLFISELQTWKLSPDVRAIVEKTVASHQPALPLSTLVKLSTLSAATPEERQSLLNAAVSWVEELPWRTPEKDDVLAVNRESQFAAWVMVHGYNVNHFTTLINSQGVATLDDIEKTIAAMKRIGIPMKAEIEGSPGSKLRQSATDAAVIDVPVRSNGQPATMPWTYAYFELAERNEIVDPETGRSGRFEGFLGPQATHLFEMTKLK